MRPGRARPDGRWLPHGVRLAALLVSTLLLLPNPAPQPAWLSLTSVARASGVDLGEGVVWILVLGSDARPGTDVVQGNTDAVQLVGIDAGSGRAAGIGIPRDSLVDLPGGRRDRINTALAEGGDELAARVVADLVGIEPDYVLVVGMAGFVDLLGTVGPVQVRSPVDFHDAEFDLTVRRGANLLDPDQALSFARSRSELDGGDFERSANQQRLMLGALSAMRARADEEGFIEAGTLVALEALRTDLAPTELYRLAQALTQVRSSEVTFCVVDGTPITRYGASVVEPDPAQAARLGRDAVDDVRLEPGCDG